MVAGLQMHTEASDGKNTIEERVEQAQEEGLDTIAITDHDTINEELDPESQEIEGVEVITGAEIKCEVDGVGIEILGYFLDPEDSSLQSLFGQMDENRENRMREMVERVNEGEDLNIDYGDDMEDKVEGTIGRPHLAEIIADEESVDDVETVNEAFNKYIGEDADADYYVETEKLEAKEVIEAIHENGGVCSLSHPGRDLPYEEADEIVSELTDHGLDALEVCYTYEHKIEDGFDISFAGHLQEQGMEESEEIADRIQQEVYRLAEKYGLIKTGGSDCHGEGSGKYNIGKVRLDEDYMDQLRAAKQSVP